MSLFSVVKSAGSVPTAAVLAGVRVYATLEGTGAAHCGSTGGRDGSAAASFRSWMVSTRLARQRMCFRMRDGSRVKCRILDSGGLLSVHVDGDYEIPGFDWAAARTIVDIGAHVGSFTVWAALRSPRARVLAVEPNPETFALLTENLGDNGLLDRVTAVNAAVGANPGVAALELVEHSLATRLARNGEGRFRVGVQRLERLLSDAGMDEVDVLKMDCEGMEYEVLGAMGPDRLGAIGAITCEYHPEPGHEVSELDRILRSAGYTVQRPDAPLGVLCATRS
jgi:FkbM family methyltransferase